MINAHDFPACYLILMLPGSKSLTDPMLTQIYVTIMWGYLATMSFEEIEN